MSHQIRKSMALWVLCLGGSAAAHLYAQTLSPPTQDLSSLSLEDLTRIDVNSVSRKSQTLFKTPAAVFVITRENIAASGANDLPELFRMVPGMQVAQIDANTWAISARGFNGRFADKMLVLVDGRSVYSEIYSGVFWDQNDVSLEDIDRIEVIRGPGGTLWGANAVNGIINIITRSSKYTLGTKAVAIGGTLENGGSIRHGAEVGSRLQYRGFAKYLKRNALKADDGGSGRDSGYSGTVGARADFQATGNDLLIFRASLEKGSGNQSVIAFDPAAGMRNAPDLVTFLGGYGMTRWEHRFQGSDLALQTSYSDQYRSELGGAGREHVLDFDFQHHLPSFHGHDAVWGLGYRLTTDHISGSRNSFASQNHLDALYSLFFQDDYTLVPEKLVLTAGFKVQHNSYTGLELQPGGRALWTIDTKHSLWGSVSRAVRTPSVQDRDLRLFEPIPPENGLPTEVLALGNPNFLSEVLVAYEAGYRQTLGDKVSIDVTTFINRYKNLRNQEMNTPYVLQSASPTLVIPVMYDNNLFAKSHGVEVAASWKAASNFHVQASYAWLNGRISLADGSPSSTGDSWSSPTTTVHVHSAWSLTRHLSLDTALYGVTRLERVSPNGIPPAKGFVRLDQHLAFHLFESFELTAGVDNLLQARHPEFDPADGYTVRSQVPRSAVLKAVWSF